MLLACNLSLSANLLIFGFLGFIKIFREILAEVGIHNSFWMVLQNLSQFQISFSSSH